MHSKLPKHARHGNTNAQTLPLLEYAERHRWSAASLAARIVGKRYGITSANTACAIAELAGFRPGGDR
jgi:hypothetical protein